VADPAGDVLILGAGIAGCALAYHLARRGVGPVCVYDPRTPAAGASGRAAGVVTEQLWFRWDVEVTRESHEEYRALTSRWDPGAYVRNGFVRWTRRREIAPLVQDAVERLRGWGVGIEEVTPAELARTIPAGRFDDVEMAIRSRDDACVTPSAITSIYAEEARHASVEFDFGRPYRSLSHVDGRWTLDLGGDVRSARRLVVAAGAWSKKLLEGLGHPLPLAPYRTQAALLRPSPPQNEPFPTAHDLDTDVYLRPESNGRILGGDGTEKVEADPERFVPGGDASFLEHLAKSLSARFPGWADSEVVASWAGVCTATPDRRPLIGPVPGAEGLYAITGFNGFGVMRAGGAARRLADLLADGDTSSGAREELAPVRPGRFPDPRTPFAPKPGFTLEAGSDPRF
jgi:sarcosine oxidase, subunit beta